MLCRHGRNTIWMMAPPTSGPKLLPSLALLLVAFCWSCDEPAGTGGPSPGGKEARRSRESKKEHAKREELTERFKVGRLDHKRIPESSGLIASRKYPGVFWTHNDSGNGPVLFAVTREGKLLAEFSLGVRNNDWEALTTDDEGHLYVGDIGNNDRNRDRVLVYRVDEPDPNGAEKATASAPLRVNATWRLKHPGQPFDAESLFVYHGKGYIISKLLTAKPAGLYSFDLADTADVQTLQHVCDLPIRSPVTDAAISADGARLAVMSLTGPNLFQIDGDVAAAANVEPKYSRYFDPKDINMEGVCFVEGGLLATTEGGQVMFFAEKDFK
jgi:hypothetical protein